MCISGLGGEPVNWQLPDTRVRYQTEADRIMRDPSVIEDGLRITDREKQTRSGAIDLHGIDRDHTPVIIEIKRSQPTPSAVLQPESIRSRPPAPAHRKRAGPRDTLHTKHTAMIQTLLTENELEWRVFKYEFEQRMMRRAHSKSSHSN